MRSVLREFRWILRRPSLKARFKVAGPRIIYGLTPTPKLRNIGDHAQVVAIMDWLDAHFPQHNVIEIDKDEIIHGVTHFKALVRPEDVIVLHSGGNMGDRGRWSETARRLMVTHFPENKIVSLPQTIYFHETEMGQSELTTSKAVYNAHGDLTIIARDKKSLELAKEYFPKCRSDVAPDFVLSYKWPARPQAATNGKVLYCLREDSESAIGETERKRLITSVGRDFDLFDTTILEKIHRHQRKQKLDETLKLFLCYDAVVTDRFHGLIFSVLTRRPTVVLPTVDHKLTSAFDWFDKVDFVRFSPTIEGVAKELDRVLRVEDRHVPDWNARYFDGLAKFFD